jgi:hypothetical protein
MYAQQAKPARRIGVLMLPVSILLMVAVIFFAREFGWSQYSVSGLAALVLLAVFGCLTLYVRIQKREIPRSRRRIHVVLNYASLVLLLICLYFLDYLESSESSLLGIPGLGFMAAGLIAFAAIVASFIGAHLRTKLWSITHGSYEDLDEREQLIVHRALSLSYAIFTVLCLSIFLVSEVLRDLSATPLQLPLIPVVAALIYTAHTLPSSILAWREREV